MLLVLIRKNAIRRNKKGPYWWTLTSPVHGRWTEAKGVEYGVEGDVGGRYPPLLSRRRGEVKRIRAMYGRRPIGWSHLFVHVLSAYHPEVQRREEGSEKKFETWENWRMCSGRRGIRKMVRELLGPGKGPKKF